MGHTTAARKRSHQWCLTLTPNNTKTIERMTCHCFLRPIRRDLTSRSYTTQMINCMITFLVNFQIILAKKKKPSWWLYQIQRHLLIKTPKNRFLPIFFTWFYMKWPDWVVLCWNWSGFFLKSLVLCLNNALFYISLASSVINDFLTLFNLHNTI